MWGDRTQPGKSGNGVWSGCGEVTKHRVLLNSCNKFEGIYSLQAGPFKTYFIITNPTVNLQNNLANDCVLRVADLIMTAVQSA